MSIFIWSAIAPKRILSRRQSTRIRTTNKAGLVFTPQKCKGILLPGSIETVLDFWQNYLWWLSPQVVTYQQRWLCLLFWHPFSFYGCDQWPHTAVFMYQSGCLGFFFVGTITYRIPFPCSLSASPYWRISTLRGFSMRPSRLAKTVCFFLCTFSYMKKENAPCKKGAHVH